MLLLLEINFLHLILPVALLLAGWPPPLPRTHPFHRGEGGWCYDHDHGRGGGGGTRNLEHIYININMYILDPLNIFIQRVLSGFSSTPAQLPATVKKSGRRPTLQQCESHWFLGNGFHLKVWKQKSAKAWNNEQWWREGDVPPLWCVKLISETPRNNI